MSLRPERDVRVAVTRNIVLLLYHVVLHILEYLTEEKKLLNVLLYY